MKKNNVIKIIGITFVFLTLFSTNSFAMVKPTPEFYVNDYANLLSADTESYIIITNKELNAKTGAQIVVVTVPNLEGDTLESYANKLFNSFGIGDKKKDNGVLLLLALEEREFRVEVGYGLEGALPDAKTGRIQDDYIIPYLKKNNWDGGIRNGFNAILNVVENEYNVSVWDEGVKKVGSTVKPLLVFALTIGLATFIFLFKGILGKAINSIEIKKNSKKTDLILSIAYMIAFFVFFKYNYMLSKGLRILVSTIFFAFTMYMLINLGVGGSSGGGGRHSRGGRSFGGGGRSGGGGSSRHF